MLNTGQLITWINREIDLSAGMASISSDYSERANLCSMCDAYTHIKGMILLGTFEESYSIENVYGEVI